jgi:hypothetical protein
LYFFFVEEIVFADKKFILSFKVLNNVNIDLVLLSSVLKDATRVEADVVSHGEAVLNGRLSKSQQRLIQQEQNRLSSLALNSEESNGSCSSRNKVGKSRSFRDTTGQKKQSQPQQRAMSRYKKTKTTNLDSRLQAANAEFSSFQSTSVAAAATSSASATSSNGIDSDESTALSSEWREVMDKEAAKRKNSFIRNKVNAIFKNMR